jgi:hypothetical protein
MAVEALFAVTSRRTTRTPRSPATCFGAGWWRRPSSPRSRRDLAGCRVSASTGRAPTASLPTTFLAPTDRLSRDDAVSAGLGTIPFKTTCCGRRGGRRRNGTPFDCPARRSRGSPSRTGPATLARSLAERRASEPARRPLFRNSDRRVRANASGRGAHGAHRRRRSRIEPHDRQRLPLCLTGRAFTQASFGRHGSREGRATADPVRNGLTLGLILEHVGLLR